MKIGGLWKSLLYTEGR